MCRGALLPWYTKGVDKGNQDNRAVNDRDPLASPLSFAISSRELRLSLLSKTDEF